MRFTGICLVLLVVAAKPAMAQQPQGDPTPVPPAQPPPPPAPASPPAYPPPPPGYPPVGSAPPGYPPAPPGYYYGPPPVGYAPPLYAPPGPPPGYQTHDGFFLRFLLGPAATSASADVAGVPFSISGGGLAFSLGIGGAVTRNLVLYGEITISTASDPSIKAGGVSQPSSGNDLDFSHIGPALAYYLSTNSYVAASIGIATLGISDSDSGNTKSETERGLGFSATVGHEFWVSANWGLGIAARVGAGRIKDDKLLAQNLSWRASSYSLLFSATFN